MTELRASEIEAFRAALVRNLGLQFDKAKDRLLGDVLRRRLGQRGDSPAIYLNRLNANPSFAEFATLAGELTVNETYFFRNCEQFRALVDVALPQRMAANTASRTLRFLSAGCATGEEAYSLAMSLREIAEAVSWNVAIRGVDISAAALEKARRARYSAWALREAPANIRTKWFRRAGREFVLDRDIQAAVCFDQCNLAAEDDNLWQAGSFDIIFCRNVLIYFAPEQAKALLARIARALQPGGYLFLGHADSLRGLSDAFDLRSSHGTFYYQLKDGSDAAGLSTTPINGVRIPAALDAAVDDRWFDSIRKASERVAALTEKQAGPRVRSPESQAADLSGVMDLLRLERYGEALTLLRSIARGPSCDPRMLLLEAVLLVNSHMPAEAEEACRQLLAVAGVNAGAHYVCALCREQAADYAAAIEHDRAAAKLDPSFAMPRLHLGLLARRAGKRGMARRDLAQALMLLEREDATRLLLFGGGFTRNALMGLCKSALRDCGRET
jgi:chemotaxis protein methyltransferase CheR